MLPTNRSATAFARGAWTGILKISTSAAVKTASKTSLNLLSRSRMKKRIRSAGVLEVHHQIAGQLGQPRAGRVGGHAEDPHAAGGVLDDEECM
jgi:hypothetical protein